MEELVVIGASGLGMEVLWVARAMNRERKVFEILGFVDDNEDRWGKIFDGSPVLGGFDWLEKNMSPQLRCVCGIGNPVVRKKIAERAQEIGLQFATLVHPSVQMSEFVELGKGVVICANSVLTTQIQLHDHVFINLSCTVGHETVMERYSNCAPGCNISGNVLLKEGAYLGTGTSVIQGLTIGEWTTVGAGSVVVRDLPPHSIAMGAPARVTRKKEDGPD